MSDRGAMLNAAGESVAVEPIAFLIVVIYQWVLVFVAGAAIAYVERKPSRTPLVAAGLAIAVMVLAVVPITASAPI